MVPPQRIARGICALEALRKLKTLKDAMTESSQKRKHRYWVNPSLLKRPHIDVDCYLLKDISWEDGTEIYNFCKMDVHKFEFILSKVENKIKKCDTSMRCPIPARTRLAIVLRFLVTGESYRTLESVASVSSKTISVFVPEVLKAIIESLQGTQLQLPTTEQEWEAIANDFNSLWQFPHVLGAISAKHIRLKGTHKTGTNRYSIALQAVSDAHGRFIYYDIVADDSNLDLTIFTHSFLFKGIHSDTLRIPKGCPLKGQTATTPFYFVGNNVFGLEKHFLKEYDERNNLTINQKALNYRLHRARQIVELAFERLFSRFRVFHRPLEVNIETAEKIVQATCILHNFLTKTVQSTETLDDIVVDANNLPKTIKSIPMQLSKDCANAKKIRENVCSYVVTHGDVPFQWEKIND